MGEDRCVLPPPPPPPPYLALCQGMPHLLGVEAGAFCVKRYRICRSAQHAPAIAAGCSFTKPCTRVVRCPCGEGKVPMRCVLGGLAWPAS